MGRENDLMLDYLRDNARVADVFNGCLFAGKQLIKADELEEAGENYTEYKREASTTQETTEAISGIMGVKNFMENKDQYQEEGKYNMCQAIREMWEDGLNQGLNQGLERGVVLSAAVLNLIRSGASDNESIARQCEATVDEVTTIRKIFGVQ